MFQLEIQSPGFSPAVISLGVGTHRIGRRPDNDHCIDDPSVSSHHCEVVVSSEGAVLRDLQSTNGTFVDGDRITECALAPGQAVRLGSVEMRFALEPRVAIPDLPPVEVVDPVLPDGARACRNHPTIRAALECPQCGKAFCEACTHQVRRVGGAGLTLCPSCSGHCRPIPLGPVVPVRKGALATWISKLTVALTTRPPSDRGPK